MTSSASTVRLTFDYDWCTRSDTVDQCHLLLAARVRACRRTDFQMLCVWIAIDNPPTES